MEKYDLPFAKIIVLRNDIAEVIINDGIDMDLAMVNEYHKFLLSHLKAPFSLLINKINSYSYCNEALEKIATLKEINFMAVVSYKNSTTITTKYLVSFPRDVEWNLEIFSNREDALDWLKSRQHESNKEN
ncbi:MAG: hypothetical protein KAI84_01560 [Gammaproteobacteria bacterium]|nr:hypothetical protein [Gammaproteobacteria bacterium]